MRGNDGKETLSTPRSNADIHMGRMPALNIFAVQNALAYVIKRLLMCPQHHRPLSAITRPTEGLHIMDTGLSGERPRNNMIGLPVIAQRVSAQRAPALSSIVEDCP